MRNKTDTKEKIIIAMLKLIAEQGYEKASISKLSDRVGITNPAVYHYFESKEAILLEIGRIIYDADWDEELKEVQKTKTATEYKNELMKKGFELAEFLAGELLGTEITKADIRKISAEIDLLSNRNEKLKELSDISYEKTIAYINNILLHGIKIKAINESADIELYAQSLYTTFLGFTSAVLYDREVNIEKIWRFQIDNILRGNLNE